MQNCNKNTKDTADKDALQQLCELRTQIDTLDDQLRQLFLERMDLVQQVGALKAEKDIPVLHTDRENEVLMRVNTGLTLEQRQNVTELFQTLFEISRRQQSG